MRSTQQITKAMKMVAAARLRRTQMRILAARPFAQKMQELINDLTGRTLHPFFRVSPSPQQAVLLITSDKGLCGAFNTNLFRRTLEYLKTIPQTAVHLFVVGRKGRGYFHRLGVRIAGDYTGVMNQLSYTHAELIGRDLMEGFLAGTFSEARMIYQEFKSVLQQGVVMERLLPLPAPDRSSNEAARQPVDFLYEPTREELLGVLLPRHVKAQIYRALLESAAAELGSRMTAMDQATRNAGELMDILTLRMNRTRQGAITKEILEVVAGTEVLT